MLRSMRVGSAKASKKALWNWRHDWMDGWLPELASLAIINSTITDLYSFRFQNQIML